MRKIKLLVLALLASAGTAQAQMTIDQLTPGKTIVLKSVSTLANHFFLNPGSASNFAYDATTNNLTVEEATYEAGEEGRTYFRLKNSAGQYIANATSGDLTLTEDAEEAAILFAVDCQNETVTTNDMLTDFRDTAHLIRFKNAATPSAFLNCGESQMKWAGGTGGYSAFYVYESTDIAGLCAAHNFVNNNGVALSDIIPAAATSETDENATVYAIKNPQSNKYLVASTASTSEESAAAPFVFVATDKANVYKIYNLSTRHFLTSSSIEEGASKVFTDGSGSNDLWFIRPNVTTGNTLSTDRIDIFPYGSFYASWNWHGGASATNIMGLYRYSDTNSVWSFSEITAETAKESLNTDLTAANAITDDETGDAVGYYDATLFANARSAAQTAYDTENGTAMTYFLAKYALQDGLAAALHMPEAGKTYKIISALPAFETTQGVQKAIYNDSGSNLKWNSMIEDNLAYYWRIAPTGNGYSLQSLSDEKYAANANSMNTTANSATLTLLAAGQFKVTLGGHTFHAESHSSGSGPNGNVINYDGEANTPSAWKIVEVDLSTVAQSIVEANSSSETPGLGEIPTSAIAPMQAAITTYSESGQSIADAQTLFAAIHEFKSQKVLPVFFIEGTINYAAGKAIYDDGRTSLYFAPTKNVNNQMLWIFDSENPAETVSAGNYTVTNLNTGNGFWGSSFLQITAIDGSQNQFTMKTDGTGWTIHAQNSGQVIVRYQDTTANSGSAWTFRYAGTTEQLAQYADAFAAYQTLVSADKTAQEAVAGYTFGTELNQFDPATRDAVTAATTAGYELVSGDTLEQLEQNKDALTAAAATIAEKVSAIDLNYPAAGTFLRIVGNPEGSTDENGYITGTPITISSKGRAVVATDTEGDNEAGTILYFDNDKLLSYATGYYMANNNGMLGYNGITTGSPIEFAKATGGTATAGFYNIHFSTNGSTFDRSLYCRKANNQYYTDGAGMPTPSDSHGYRFRLEAVSSLPVTVTEAGYASLYAPVALTIPTDVDVFVGHRNDDGWFTLEPLTGVIPANTGVILRAAADTYHFDIAADAETVSNELTGTTASIVTADGAYTLQQGDEGIGLYPYTGSELKGFRAYATFGETQGIKGLAFRFGDVTAIDNAINLGAAKDAPIYDMSGRRVVKMQKGVYIVGGKKVIMK